MTKSHNSHAGRRVFGLTQTVRSLVRSRGFTGIVGPALAVCLFWTAGCNDNDNGGGGTSGSRVNQPPPKSSKALRMEKYADVTDPAKLFEGWKEELIEGGDFKADSDGTLRTSQFSFGYTWTFTDTTAELAVTEEFTPEGLPLPGRDILYQYIVEVQGLWAEDGLPRFMRAKDGPAGDQAISSLKEKIFETAQRHAEETDDASALEALRTQDDWGKLKIAYTLLLNTGTVIEGESITGNLFEIQANATYHEDGRIECHLLLTALDPASAAESSATSDMSGAVGVAARL